MGPISLAALKAKKAPPQIITKKVSAPAHAKPVSTPRGSSGPPPRNISLTGVARQSSAPRQSSASTSSRPSSKEPVERVKEARTNRLKRSSPAVSTPRLTSSDEEDNEEDEAPKKRPRLSRPMSSDDKRQIRDLEAFVELESDDVVMVHAANIANVEIVEQSRDKYAAFFTALNADEDECPTIHLRYPTASRRERFQLVRPTDPSDFKPLDEIIHNMRIVAEYYMDEKSAEKIDCEEDGSGLVQMLQRHAKEGLRGRVGAQQKFIDVVQSYNNLLDEKRKDGTIAKIMDNMAKVDIRLVEHIIKNQIYARTVSPQVHLVRQYEGFSDNVYGELLPKFLNKIFKETHLKSDQVFVDLGSGVGNCVLQAALEIGCESWGCEMMDNPDTLAQLQAKEFPARCRLWGIKPGDVHLIHDDFLKNEEIRKVIKRADVLMINNQAFTPTLNDKLKYMFLDLKEGCQIVSLKYFRDPSHKIKETNTNDPVNVLTVEEKERWSGMVSWSDIPGKWYLHRKDSRALEAFVKGRR